MKNIGVKVRIIWNSKQQKTKKTSNNKYEQPTQKLDRSQMTKTQKQKQAQASVRKNGNLWNKKQNKNPLWRKHTRVQNDKALEIEKNGKQECW